jgi:hypothetical protein
MLYVPLNVEKLRLQHNSLFRANHACQYSAHLAVEPHPRKRATPNTIDLHSLKHLRVFEEVALDPS